MARLGTYNRGVPGVHDWRQKRLPMARSGTYKQRLNAPQNWRQKRHPMARLGLYNRDVAVGNAWRLKKRHVVVCFLCLALRYFPTCTILCFVLILGEAKRTLFFAFAMVFERVKTNSFALLPKPKQNRARQAISIRLPSKSNTNERLFSGDDVVEPIEDEYLG